MKNGLAETHHGGKGPTREKDRGITYRLSRVFWNQQGTSSLIIRRCLCAIRLSVKIRTRSRWARQRFDRDLLQNDRRHAIRRCQGHVDKIERSHGRGRDRAGRCATITSHPDFRLHFPTVRVGSAASTICRWRQGRSLLTHRMPARAGSPTTSCGIQCTRAGTGGGGSFHDAMRRAWREFMKGARYDPDKGGDINALCKYGNP